jgi:signal peptidase I
MVNEGGSGSDSRTIQTHLAPGIGNRGWIVLTVWLFLVVIISGYFSSWIHSIPLNIYVFQPLLWLSVGFLAIWLGRSEPQMIPLSSGGWVTGMAALVGGFQVAVLMLAGVAVGFGRSPYTHQLGLMLLNIWLVVAKVLGLEFSRWYLVSVLKRRNDFLGVGLAWLIIFLATLPVTRLWTTQLDGADGIFRLVGNVILPTAANNALATYLVMVGGPAASIAYSLVLNSYEWITPILPDLEWTLNAFLGTIVPILGLLFFKEALDWRAFRKGDQEVKEGIWGTGWVLVGVFLVFLLWFNSGLFGVRPTLISGISMEPAINPGDIVITRDITPSEIKVNDVVLFNNGKVSILHRVIKMEGQGENLIFTTKGDNVAEPDQSWNANQLRGKLVVVIPKLGWVSLGVKMFISRIF